MRTIRFVWVGLVLVALAISIGTVLDLLKRYGASGCGEAVRARQGVWLQWDCGVDVAASAVRGGVMQVMDVDKGGCIRLSWPPLGGVHPVLAEYEDGCSLALIGRMGSGSDSRVRKVLDVRLRKLQNRRAGGGRRSVAGDLSGAVTLAIHRGELRGPGFCVVIDVGPTYGAILVVGGDGLWDFGSPAWVRFIETLIGESGTIEDWHVFHADACVDWFWEVGMRDDGKHELDFYPGEFGLLGFSSGREDAHMCGVLFKASGGGRK